MLRPCPVCGVHLRVGHACPSCESPRAARPTAAAALLALGLAGCPFADKESEPGETADMAMYGIAYVDEDGDGYNSYEDCNDQNPDVYPDAPETKGDGVDSNCDGDDNT